MVQSSDDGVAVDSGGVKGFLLTPTKGAQQGLVLTHGAGGNCSSPLLLAIARAFHAAGFAVLRCDLPFRQDRRSGPPNPGKSAIDRAGLKSAVEFLRPYAPSAVYLGGHSYGGRQASMLAAEAPDLAAGLLLLSYPLHPPTKPQALRVDHFPKLQTPALFVHGVADPFGSIAEMERAIALIPAARRMITIEGAGHDLARGRLDPAPIVAALVETIGQRQARAGA
jgi:predicted alpha/beta-hydrolase family hydrolase